eukprot:1246561-Prymnesium_polylepis.1
MHVGCLEAGGKAHQGATPCCKSMLCMLSMDRFSPRSWDPREPTMICPGKVSTVVSGKKKKSERRSDFDEPRKSRMSRKVPPSMHMPPPGVMCRGFSHQHNSA